MPHSEKTLFASTRDCLVKNWHQPSAGRFYLLLVVAIWSVWLLCGGRYAITHLVTEWPVALTMTFGAFIGSSTSAGGGAVAFPVFTKLLHVTPRDARDFSLAIQGVGMGAATLSILYLRIPIERRTLAYAGLSGVAGVVFGTIYIAPLVPSALVRVVFTVLVSSMGLALVLANRDAGYARNQLLPRFGIAERSVLCGAGLFGGLVTALIGSGENTVIFILLVLLFRVSEKVATPTTVVLMTIVTIPGFLLHLLCLKDFSPAAMSYWAAAVPVVVVMGPLGALTCAHMKRRSVVLVLLLLVLLECISTSFAITFSRSLLYFAAGALLVFAGTTYLLSRVRLYVPAQIESKLPSFHLAVPVLGGEGGAVLQPIDNPMAGFPLVQKQKIATESHHSCGF